MGTDLGVVEGVDEKGDEFGEVGLDGLDASCRALAGAE